jgi:hypothetical protein
MTAAAWPASRRPGGASLSMTRAWTAQLSGMGISLCPAVGSQGLEGEGRLEHTHSSTRSACAHAQQHTLCEGRLEHTHSSTRL